MANHGPPGGPPEPWPGRHPHDPYGSSRDPYGAPADPYGAPADPYGRPEQRWGQDARNGRPPAPPRYPPIAPRYPPRPERAHANGYPTADPDGYRPGQPPPPHWTPGPAIGGSAGSYPPPAPPAPPRRRGRGPLIVVLVLVLLLGAGTAAYVLLDRDAGSTPSAAPSAGAATPPATARPTATPGPESSLDPRFVKVGQCVRNEGPTGGKPKLVITECGPRTYQVLRRFDGATSGEQDAEAKCAKVPGYTNWYFFNSPLDTLDFVLCLKSR